MIEKIGKFVDGKVAAGLIAVSSLWSAWNVNANGLGQTTDSTKSELREAFVRSAKDEKTIDFQQARKSWEVKKTPETKNVAGENLILDEQGVEEYFAQNGTVPYLSNGATIDGNWAFEAIADGMDCYYYLSNNDHVSITKPEGVDRVYVSWACEELEDKIEITWHAVISFGKWSKLINVIFNNGANFVKQWEEKIVEQADTFHIVKNLPEGTELPKEFIEQVFWKVVSFDNETKFLWM